MEVRDGDLSVRGDRQSERHSTELRSILRHLGDRVPAAPPARPGRHRKGRVRREERSNGVDVPLRPGIDVGLDELAVRPSPSERSVACWLRREGARRPPAGALEGAVDRRHCRVERRRGLTSREAEHLAQDQDRALRRAAGVEGRRRRRAPAPRAARSERPARHAALDAEGSSGYGSTQTDSTRGSPTSSPGPGGP